MGLNFNNEQGLIDFDAVRVGEAKEKEFNLKNNGMYPVKYNFTLKKKAAEMFTVIPVEGVLQQNEEKAIIVRFLCQK